MQRLSGLDAAFLYLETPNNHMHVASVLVFEGELSLARVRALLEDRMHLLAPLRRRLVEVPFGLHHPVWIEDADFSLDAHLHAVTVPRPGGARELAELAGKFMSVPLDRRRPLWEIWVVGGLRDGRSALFTKTHHAAVDGASGAELLSRLFDLTPDTTVHGITDPWQPDEMPSGERLIADATRDLLRQPGRLARVAADSLRRAVDVRQQAANDGLPMPLPVLSPPKVSFSKSLSAQRIVGMTELPLADLKSVRSCFGGTINDVVLAVCSGALRSYLVGRGEPADESLVALVPMSVREPDGVGGLGNRITNMLVALASDVGDARARLEAVQRNAATSKRRAEVIGGQTLSQWAGFAAPAVAVPAARVYSALRLAERHRPLFNLTISNIPGPDFALYTAGERLRSWYPLGPIFEGNGLNITVMSYRGTMHVGVVACPRSVPTLEPILEGMRSALGDLTALAGPPASSPSATSRPKGRRRARNLE